jgi:hypothetical protein
MLLGSLNYGWSPWESGGEPMLVGSLYSHERKHVGALAGIGGLEAIRKKIDGRRSATNNHRGSNTDQISGASQA